VGIGMQRKLCELGWQPLLLVLEGGRLPVVILLLLLLMAAHILLLAPPFSTVTIGYVVVEHQLRLTCCPGLVGCY
jgi:hypothetical protein